MAKGAALTAKINRVRFAEAAHDVITDYQINGKKSLRATKIRIEKHLIPYFGTRRLTSISASTIRDYVKHRQGQTTIVTRTYAMTGRDGRVHQIPARVQRNRPPSNGQLNRELAILKRIFKLAIEGGKILQMPTIKLLDESDNVRTGFFEREQLEAVLGYLPTALRPVVVFAYLTGWRLAAEILSLEWRQIDFAGNEIRLYAGLTKNKKGRVFPMTDELRILLLDLQRQNQDLKKKGFIVPSVFVRLVAKGRGGDQEPRPIRSIKKAFAAACRTSGLPGKIPHDFRRTAVRNMVRRGVPERVAMKLTGHKTRSIFDRYDIVSGSDLTRAAQQLSGQLGASLNVQTPVDH